MFYYTLFGLSICSEIPLPLAEGVSRGTPDILVCKTKTPLQRTHRKCIGTRRCGYALHGTTPKALFFTDCREISFPGIARFQVTSGTPLEIIIDAEGSPSDHVLAEMLLGEVFGVAIRFFGLMPIHAGCVEFGGRRICILGDGGTGKSTFVSALVAKGCLFLSDDISALRSIDGRIEVRESVPYVKLWDSAAKHIIPGQPGTPLVGYRNKSRYDVTGWGKRAEGWKELHSAILLMRVHDSSSRTGFTILTEQEAFLALLKSQISGFALTDNEWIEVQIWAKKALEFLDIRAFVYASGLSHVDDATESFLQGISCFGEAVS